jgi:predicted NBD/HSP70 family sugar kinase
MKSKRKNVAWRVLNYLFQNQGASRKQIADALKVRPGTIGTVCGQLIRNAHLHASDNKRQRNVILKVNPGKYQAMGVEHNADGLLTLIMTSDLQVKQRERIKIPENLDGSERLKKITMALERLIQKSRERNTLLGLGFCDIGMFDPHTGRSIRSVLLPEWNDMPVKGSLERSLKIPVALFGNMDSMCMAEHKFGAAGNWPTFACVMFDRVIGFSLMNRGTIICGNHPVCGELGHVVCNPAGEICKCGNRGCLETMAGTDAIVKKVCAHMPAADGKIFNIEKDKLTIEHVIEAAKNGYKLAETAMLEAAEAAGLALAQILSVLGVKNILLAGKLPLAGDIFLEPLRRAVRQYCVYPLNTQLEFAVGSLDEWAGAKGTAYSVLQNYFSNNKNES